MDVSPLTSEDNERVARLPRGLQVRLTIAIPLVVCGLVMLSGFLTLWLGRPLFFQEARPMPVEEVERRVVLAFGAVAVFTLVSLVIAIAVARGIARRLRALALRMESLGCPVADGPDGPREQTELAALDSALEGVVSSVSTLIHDSYTLHSLESGVATVGRNGVVTSLNPVAAAILDLPAGEAVGRSFTDLVPDVPANREFRAAALREAPGASSAEATIVTCAARAVELGYTVSPLRNEAGAVLGVVFTFKDLAERKQAEHLMRRAENLALLGTMATSVAHEVRNPLGAMNGLVELIRDEAPPEAPQRRYCEKILQSIERINRICKELLTIGNPEPRSVEPLDINDVARSTVEFCRYEAGRREVAVHDDYAADLPLVPGDRERLGQVLLNILRNAFQATRGGGEIFLTTRRAGDAVAVAVRNTGPPIPPDVQKKLFTLFYTTKQRGTGLGLAVSQQLVRAHGGRILVDSGPERGTTFTIELPTHQPEPALVG